MVEAYRHTQQHDRHHSDFYGGVPAVEVGGGIGFGDAHGLGAADGFVEAAAFFDFGEDDVGGGVEDAGEAADFRGGEAERKHGEDGDAVHHRGFIEEFLAFFAGECGEFVEGVDDGAFVGGDGVSAEFERGLDVVGGGLARLYIEGTGFEEDVGAAALEPFADVARSLVLRWLRGPMIVEDGQRIEAVGVGAPAVAARGDSGEAPADVVAAAELGFFGNEEAEERAANVPEPDDR